MNAGHTMKASVASPLIASNGMTDSLIASMMEKTDQLHKQLYQLTEKLELVLMEESPQRPFPEDTAAPVACRLHERLTVLQDALNGVSRHIHNLSERVVL